MTHEMKFSLATLRQLDLPNLLIDISFYADSPHCQDCSICQQYLKWSIQAAKEKWSSDFKDF